MRALIIRTESNPDSVNFANQCAISCKQHNLKYNFVSAVESLSCRDSFASVGIDIPEGECSIRTTPGEICPMHGCFASHYKSWGIAAERDEPTVILEHDALLLETVPEEHFVDNVITVLGFRVAQRDGYKPIGPVKTAIPLKRTFGTHAYAITKQTALLLRTHAKQNPHMMNLDPADYMVKRKLHGLELTVLDPSPAIAYIRGSTITSRSFYSSRPSGYLDSMPDSWFEGLKDGYEFTLAK